MLDVCLLGTAGMMPLPNRWLTALSLKYNGSNILIDCGEGTQIAMKEAGINFKPIDILCITHFHADNIRQSLIHITTTRRTLPCRSR